MSKDIKESIVDLDKSITNLEKIVVMSTLPNDVVLISSIKVFEMSFELFWKTLGKKLFKDHGIEAVSPKQILQQAYSIKLIDNEKMWLHMLKDRNLGTHVYKQNLANDIFERVKKQYASFLRSEFDKCFKN